MGHHIPYFTPQGEKEKLQKFFSNLLTLNLVSGTFSECLYLLLTVDGVFVVFGVLPLGNDLVPWVLGAAYQPMAIHLLPLSLTLPVQVLSNMAIPRTLVNNYLKKRRWLQG